MRNVLANYISKSGNIRISFSTQLNIFQTVDFSIESSISALLKLVHIIFYGPNFQRLVRKSILNEIR